VQQSLPFVGRRVSIQLVSPASGDFDLESDPVPRS